MALRDEVLSECLRKWKKRSFRKVEKILFFGRYHEDIADMNLTNLTKVRAEGQHRCNNHSSTVCLDRRAIEA